MDILAVVHVTLVLCILKDFLNDFKNFWKCNMFGSNAKIK